MAAQRRRIEERDAAFAAQQKAAAAQKARGQALMRRHKVTRKDTPESIAQQYDVTPQAIADVVPRLRAGQVIDIPTEAQRPRFDATVAQPVAPYQPTEAGRFGRGAPVAGPTPEELGVPFELMTIEQQNQALAGVFGPTPTPEWAGPDYGLAQEQARIEQQEAYVPPEAGRRPLTGADLDRFDPVNLDSWRREIEAIHEARIEEEKVKQGLFALTMRYTGQALDYVHTEMVNGNPEWKDILRNTIPGSDEFGQITMYITAGDTWDSGPMKEQFSPEMWAKIEELGFVMVEEDLWMIPDVLEADYGMGGWSYPGYGGGYGFGGGDYEYLSRGGQLRRKAGGGVSTGERYRIFPEGVSPAHWRI